MNVSFIQQINPMASHMLAILVDVTIKSTVLFAIAWALTLPRFVTASLRRFIWLVTLLSFIVIPSLRLIFPWRAQKPIFRISMMSWDRTVEIRDVSTAVYPKLDGHSHSASLITDKENNMVRDKNIREMNLHANPRYRLSAPVIIMFAWLLVALTLFFRMVAILFKLQRSKKRLLLIDDSHILGMIESTRARLNIRQTIRTAYPDEEHSFPAPLTWGFIQPVLIVPQDFSGWDEDRINVVILHELAHIHRADWLAQLTGYLVCTIHWFNPLAWLVYSNLKRESDRAADDMVLCGGIDGTVYATHLLDIARTIHAKRPSNELSLTMAQMNGLDKRIKDILSIHRIPGTASFYVRIATMTIMMLVLLVAYQFQVMSFGSSDTRTDRVSMLLHSGMKIDRISTPIALLANGAMVKLLGVKDSNTWSSQWWGMNGKRINVNTLGAKYTYTPSINTIGRIFAVQFTYNLIRQPKTKWVGFTNFGNAFIQRSLGSHIYYRAFTPTWLFEPDHHIHAVNLVKAKETIVGSKIDNLLLIPHSILPMERRLTLYVGVACGKWTKIIRCPKRESKTIIHNPTGNIYITVVTNPRHYKSYAMIMKNRAIVMESDQFTRPIHIGIPLTAYYEGDQYERTLLCLDSKRRVMYSIPMSPNGIYGDRGHYRSSFMGVIPNSILDKVKTFQICLRPIEWVAFRNVALHPGEAQ